MLLFTNIWWNLFHTIRPKYEFISNVYVKMLTSLILKVFVQILAVSTKIQRSDGISANPRIENKKFSFEHFKLLEIFRIPQLYSCVSIRLECRNSNCNILALKFNSFSISLSKLHLNKTLSLAFHLAVFMFLDFETLSKLEHQFFSYHVIKIFWFPNFCFKK